MRDALSSRREEPTTPANHSPSSVQKTSMREPFFGREQAVGSERGIKCAHSVVVNDVGFNNVVDQSHCKPDARVRVNPQHMTHHCGKPVSGGHK